MLVDIEKALVVSRRGLLKRGHLEPRQEFATAADSVYSFCIAHIFSRYVEAPKSLIPALTELGLGPIGVTDDCA